MNISLIGMMGSGKTCIGELLAKLLNMSFVDTDEQIIKTEKASINQIFAQKGETYFRKMETATLKNVLNFNNQIISTGGGIIKSDENLSLLKEKSIVFYLKANPDILFERIKNNKERPLLNVENMKDKIKTILQERIKATKESSYPIIIEENILEKAYEYILKYTSSKKFLVVTNDKIFNLYGEYLRNDNSEFVVLPDGEVYKSMEYLNKILDKALEIKLERKDAIIALGGGVIGDMAGFAAAIYQRGIDFIQIPTTLLAQVDSSVGGKVAVNHKLGKNMLGAFYQPKLVLSDTNVLKTLDERQFKTGLSEVIKYAFIEKTCNAEENYNFYEFLKENKEKICKRDTKALKELITICCKLKSAVVNQDEKEKGLRAILNFGHTYAHAIENITNYEKYTHGEAVSIGMKLIFDLALSMGKISEEYYKDAISLIKEYDLVTSLDYTPDREKFYDAMKSDKKVSNQSIMFVMPKDRKEVGMENKIDKKLILQGI